MLTWIRRYQRYIYVIITVIIVISFSFFGTYSAFQSPYPQDEIAFRAIDGKQVRRSEVEALSIFISSDSDEKTLYGGIWGPNFLNDGVIKKDFLETGLAEILFSSYHQDLKEDLQRKHQKERRYTPYTHPQASFLSAHQVWSAVAPDLYQHYQKLRNADDPVSEEAFADRIQLFLKEREFPSPALKQVLRYQEKQYGWISPDPQLDSLDLSLFGYHVVEDWFGPNFSRLMSAFIINAAKIAQQRGYTVSKSETWADLIHNAEESFQQNRMRVHLGVSNASEYMQEQLRRMGLDKTKAIEIWRQVLLFRRLFHEFGNATLVDPLPYEQFHDFSGEFVDIDVYRLPDALQLSDFRDLQQLQTYIDAVSPQETANRDPLFLPQQFASVEEVESRIPELVQRGYILDIASINKNLLAATVSLKETWDWEVEPENWEKLREKFPELGVQPAETRSEKFASLETLDAKTRAGVDRLARNALLDAKPERIQKALAESETVRETFHIRKKGGDLPVQGLQNNEEAYTRFLALLESLSLSEEQKEALSFFTADDIIYYRITIVEREPEKTILSFAEAKKDGTADNLVVERLDAYYQEIREENPSLYKKSDDSWKELREVRNSVAQHYWQDLLQAIREEAPTSLNDKEWTNDELARYRFWDPMQQKREKILANSEEEGVLFISADEKPSTLADQWLLVKEGVRVDRVNENTNVDLSSLKGLAIGEWSDIQIMPSGQPSFFQVEGKGVAEPDQATLKHIAQVHRLLSADAQRTLLRSLLPQLEEKNALSLQYVKKTRKQ